MSDITIGQTVSHGTYGNGTVFAHGTWNDPRIPGYVQVHFTIDAIPNRMWAARTVRASDLTAV